jgi:hypothetical protein
VIADLLVGSAATVTDLEPKPLHREATQPAVESASRTGSAPRNDAACSGVSVAA